MLDTNELAIEENATVVSTTELNLFAAYVC